MMESIKMKVFFQYAWKKRPKQCQCGCGQYLPKEINTACMDHLLAKSIYPECKYSIKNIFFCTADCHARKSNGFPNEKHKEMIEWAKENYDILKEESAIFEDKLGKLIDQAYGKIKDRQDKS